MKRQNHSEDRTFVIKRFEENKPKTLYTVHWSVLSELLKLCRTLDLEERRAVKVLILRMGPAEHYAVIGPLDLEFVHGVSIRYLVFPYAEE